MLDSCILLYKENIISLNFFLIQKFDRPIIWIRGNLVSKLAIFVCNFLGLCEILVSANRIFVNNEVFSVDRTEVNLFAIVFNHVFIIFSFGII